MAGTHMLTLMVVLLTVKGILYSTSFWISAMLRTHRRGRARSAVTHTHTISFPAHGDFPKSGRQGRIHINDSDNFKCSDRGKRRAEPTTGWIIRGNALIWGRGRAHLEWAALSDSICRCRCCCRLVRGGSGPEPLENGKIQFILSRRSPTAG